MLVGSYLFIPRSDAPIVAVSSRFLLAVISASTGQRGIVATDREAIRSKVDTRAVHRLFVLRTVATTNR